MKITDKPVIVFLGGILGAFLAAIACISWLDNRINAAIDRRSQTLPWLQSQNPRVIRQGDFQICWGDIECHDSPTGRDGKWRVARQTFESPFIAPPQVVFTPHPKTGTNAPSIFFSPYVSDVTHTSMLVHLEAFLLVTNNSNPRVYQDSVVHVDYVAIGRWR